MRITLLAWLISPTILMLVAMLATIVGMVMAIVHRRRQERILSTLAREWQMHYSPRDVFNLAPRVVPRLPALGTSDVRISDLIYASEQQGHRYIFCAEYTTGTVRPKSHQRCVISILERRDRSDLTAWLSIKIAPSDLPLIDQYKALKTSND